MKHPQTIQIFLPSGDPQSLRIAAVTTRVVSMIEIPRAQLDLFLKRPEANQVGIYFLFGEDDQTAQPKAYVGQTGKLGTRLKEHNEKKDFWNRAVVAVSLTGNITLTHAYFLEAEALEKASVVGRYVLENKTTGTSPHTLPAMAAECRELFETIHVLLTTLGYPLFEAMIKKSSSDGSSVVDETDTAAAEVFFCQAEGVDGRGYYTEEGMVVLKGSYGRRASPAFEKSLPSCAARRQAAIEEGVLTWDEERLVLTRDVILKNPSPAASFLLGRSANGWTEWKNKEGRTLSQCVREIGQSEELTGPASDEREIS